MSPASAAKPTAEAGVTEIPMLTGGEWRAAAESYEVRDPYRNTVVAKAPRSALTDLDDALDAAVKAKAKAAATPAFERAT
jgi:acyl-CoA reductase-like NAD-dependent aldehyde dehydrogenase